MRQLPFNKSFSWIFIMVLLTFSLYAQEKNHRIDDGKSCFFINRTLPHGFEATFRLDPVYEYILTNQSGLRIGDLPELSNLTVCFAIPEGCEPTIDVLETEIMDLKLSLRTHQNEINTMRNPFIEITGQFRSRGLNIAVANVFPFKAPEPGTKDWQVCRSIKFKVYFSGGNHSAKASCLRNPWWDHLILSRMLLNYTSLPGFDEQRVFNLGNKEEGAEYLIITPNGEAFIQWADTLKNFRTQQGILTKVTTLSEIGGNSPELIESYIDDAYNNWNIPPVAVLILGDYGTNPSNSVMAPVWDNYCVSDNRFADIDNDDLPDLYIGRICAQTEEDLANTVGKVIHYESEPPVITDFYNDPITSVAFQPAGIRQIIVESVAGFYEVVLGKSTNRINVATSPLPGEWTTLPEGLALVSYFGPEGLGYIPATPAGVNSAWDGTTQDLINGINDGAFMTLFMGIGSETGWAQPSFTIDDLSGLNNSCPTFVWSMTSLTGKFNFGSDCFAESIHKFPGGALGIVAASEVTYVQTGELITLGAFDQMWPEYLPASGTTFSPEGVYPAVALVAGKYFLAQYPWPLNPNNKKVAYHAYHYFGDIFSSVYTEVPQQLTVSHPGELLAGSNTVLLTVNEGALIGLCLNQELIASAFGTGNEIEITTPELMAGDTLTVTITKQNYYRYSASIPVKDFTSGGTFQKINAGEPCFRIFPNPARNNQIRIKLSGIWPDAPVQISMLDSRHREIGQSMMFYSQKDIYTINTSGLQKGLYYLVISSEIKCWVKKVLVI